MPVDLFAGKFVVKTRNEIRDDYLADYLFRCPEANVGPDTQPWIDASTAADAAMPIYYDIKLTASVVDIDNAVGAQLDLIGNADGVPRLPESTSQGFVVATAASGGGDVIQGRKLRHPRTRAEYQVLVSKSLSSDDLTFAVASVITGTEANLAAGSTLQWDNPPVGLGSLVTVDSNGLRGGGPEEDDDTYRARIKDAKANPAAAANWAHYCKVVESLSANIQKGFAIPAIRGPGTIGVGFTVKPPSPGGDRKPTSGQIAIVEIGTTDDQGMPIDDGALFFMLADHDVVVALRVKWNSDAPGWVDTAPWPPSASPGIRVGNSMDITATAFEVESTGGAVAEPTPGKTIALWNSVTKKMVAKRIISVTPNFGYSWFIETDSGSPTSDVVFAPTYGQRVSPWADSANDISPIILAYFDQQGPGEQLNFLPDPNGRQARHPLSPRSWPSVLSNRMLDDVFDLEGVSDAAVLEPSLPFPTTVGTPGVVSYLHRLSDLSMFPG